MQAHGRMDVPLPPGPNSFLFSEPVQCERSLAAAGFRSPIVTTVPQVWRVASPEAPFEAVMRATVRHAAGAYLRDGAIELAMPAVVAAAEQP